MSAETAATYTTREVCSSSHAFRGLLGFLVCLKGLWHPWQDVKHHWVIPITCNSDESDLKTTFSVKCHMPGGHLLALRVAKKEPSEETSTAIMPLVLA
jgi:hypothetical protein